MTSTFRPTSSRVRWGQVWRDRLIDQGWLDRRQITMGLGTIARVEVNDVEVAAGRLTRIWNAPGSHEAVWIDLPILSAEEWETVVEIAAASARHSAALIDNALDASFIAAVRDAGVELLPPPTHLTPRCGCDERVDFCSHAVALMHAALHEVNVNAFVLFALQGRTHEQLLDAVRRRRRGATPAPQAAATKSMSAIEAWTRPRGPLPVVPRSPATPGNVAGWSTDSSDLAVDPDVLQELAEDAVQRSWAMMRGDGASALRLDMDADIARRAVGLLGTTRIVELAREIGEPAERVIGLATAWRAAGPGGLALLSEPYWDPDQFIMVEAAESIEASGRRASSIVTDANTITVADKTQYRHGRDELWYRLDKRANHWMLMTAPAADIGDVILAVNGGR